MGAYVLETAVLLTSGLVTNAIVHARSPVILNLSYTDGSLRIGVTDDNEQLPTQQVGGDELAGGRGLLAVKALAERWGATPKGRKRSVWFELASAHESDGSVSQPSEP